MKLFFYAPQPKSLVLRAFLTKRKERKLQYQWYHNFRSYMVRDEGLEPSARGFGVAVNAANPLHSWLCLSVFADFQRRPRAFDALLML